MSRRVDQVERIGLPAAIVEHLDGVALDGDAALFLQVHVVEHLAFRHGYRVGLLQEAVGQGGLPVVYVGYDAEVADILIHR